MDEQTIRTVLTVERKMYNTLNEVMELTQEMSEAVRRQDGVSVRLFLKMRREPIQQLGKYRALLEQQCVDLPQPEGEALRHLLSGESTGGTEETQPLEHQVKLNQSLLQRIIQADRAVSEKINPKKSFYIHTGHKR